MSGTVLDPEAVAMKKEGVFAEVMLRAEVPGKPGG